MEYLVDQNRAGAGDSVPQQLSAAGRHVVILGGGDTGADCIGTAHRQGAASVTTLAIGTQPPTQRTDAQPWPTHPVLFEVSSAHEEGGERTFLATTVEFLGSAAGEVTGVRVAETEFRDGARVPKPGTERDIPADLVLLALGFEGTDGVAGDGAVPLREGRVLRDAAFATDTPGVFAAGDAGRGQSLIVWAIAEGRAAAAAVDDYLEGGSSLPAPVKATDRAVSV